MAGICSVCNHAVDDKDILCPNCGADLTKGAAKPDVDDILNSVLRAKQAAPAEAPTAQQPEPAEPDKTPNTPLENQAAPPAPIAPDFGDMPDDDMALQPVSAPVRTNGRGALEATIEAAPRDAHGNRVSRVLIVLVVIAILALLTTIFLFYIIPATESNRQQKEILDYLGGAWISDEFAFVESTSKNYVEVLEVNADGTYRMIYAEHDEAYPDGWRTGEWAVEYEISGNIVYDASTQQLLLLYEEGDEGYAFSRVIVVREENEMCLREYYDESKTSFYDVMLYRINLPEE